MNILLAVIEVANGDYGEFVPQLAASANRSLCFTSKFNVVVNWQLKFSAIQLKFFEIQLKFSASDKTTSDFDDDDKDTPVIRVDTLTCVDVPLLKQQQTGESKDMDVITPPSEWSKFWTLVGRCQMCYYRDWVNKNIH